MSLTSELEDPAGDVRRFFETHFPNLRVINGEVREAAAAQPTILPSERVPYGTVGTAIDHRIRLYFPPSPADELNIQELLELDVGPGLYLHTPSSTAEWGAGMLVGAGRLSGELWRVFFRSLWETARSSPAGTRLERADEERLCRHCYVLGLFEEIVRAGLAIRSPLYTLPEHAGLDDLVGLASPASVEDLCRLSWAFYDSQGDLLACEATHGPTFDGSLDVGGADADLILDRCLIEIKTALDPTQITKRPWPWQLLGYALLDYGDTYAIEDLGLYLARQATFVRWPLEEYATKLAGRGVSVAETRRDFQALFQKRPAG